MCSTICFASFIFIVSVCACLSREPVYFCQAEKKTVQLTLAMSCWKRETDSDISIQFHKNNRSHIVSSDGLQRLHKHQQFQLPAKQHCEDCQECVHVHRHANVPTRMTNCRTCEITSTQQRFKSAFRPTFRMPRISDDDNFVSRVYVWKNKNDSNKHKPSVPQHRRARNIFVVTHIYIYMPFSFASQNCHSTVDRVFQDLRTLYGEAVSEAIMQG